MNQKKYKSLLEETNSSCFKLKSFEGPFAIILCEYCKTKLKIKGKLNINSKIKIKGKFHLLSHMETKMHKNNIAEFKERNSSEKYERSKSEDINFKKTYKNPQEIIEKQTDKNMHQSKYQIETLENNLQSLLFMTSDINNQIDKNSLIYLVKIVNIAIQESLDNIKNIYYFDKNKFNSTTTEFNRNQDEKTLVKTEKLYNIRMNEMIPNNFEKEEITDIRKRKKNYQKFEFQSEFVVFSKDEDDCTVQRKKIKN